MITIRDSSNSPVGIMPEITLKGENSIYSSSYAFLSASGLTLKGSSDKTDSLDIHYGEIWSDGDLTVENINLKVKSDASCLESNSGNIVIKDATIKAESNYFAIRTNHRTFGDITIKNSVVTALMSNSYRGIEAAGSIDFDNSFICSYGIKDSGGQMPSGTNSVLVTSSGAGSADTLIYNGSGQDGVGATFTLTKDAEIPEGFSLVLENGETLNIAKDVTLSGAGTLDYSDKSTTVNMGGSYGECTVLTQIGPDSALYSVAFNANGGSGEMASVTGIKSGEEFSLPLCTFTPPENKFFMGWALSSDGEAIDTTTITVDKPTTLYALWGGVTVTPADNVTVSKGANKQFSAVVDGVNNPAITWSVEGNNSEGTKIYESGVLVAALDETATSLTVKATYNGIEATANVTVIEHVHSYGEPIFMWNTVNLTDTDALFWCENCDDYQEIPANVTSTVTAPTCTEKGKIIYMVSVEFNGKSYTESMPVDGDPATGHTYGEPVWNWSNDYTSARAEFTCVNGDDRPTVTATVSTVRVEPSGTKDGSITYTATVTFRGNTYTDVKSVATKPSAANVSIRDGKTGAMVRLDRDDDIGKCTTVRELIEMAQEYAKANNVEFDTTKEFKLFRSNPEFELNSFTPETAGNYTRYYTEAYQKIHNAAYRLMGIKFEWIETDRQRQALHEYMLCGADPSELVEIAEDNTYLPTGNYATPEGIEALLKTETRHNVYFAILHWDTFPEAYVEVDLDDEIVHNAEYFLTYSDEFDLTVDSVLNHDSGNNGGSTGEPGSGTTTSAPTVNPPSISSVSSISSAPIGSIIPPSTTAGTTKTDSTDTTKPPVDDTDETTSDEETIPDDEEDLIDGDEDLTDNEDGEAMPDDDEEATPDDDEATFEDEASEPDKSADSDLSAADDEKNPPTGVETAAGLAIIFGGLAVAAVITKKKK